MPKKQYLDLNRKRKLTHHQSNFFKVLQDIIQNFVKRPTDIIFHVWTHNVNNRYFLEMQKLNFFQIWIRHSICDTPYTQPYSFNNVSMYYDYIILNVLTTQIKDLNLLIIWDQQNVATCPGCLGMISRSILLGYY